MIHYTINLKIMNLIFRAVLGSEKLSGSYRVFLSLPSLCIYKRLHPFLGCLIAPLPFVPASFLGAAISKCIWAERPSQGIGEATT